MQPAPNFLDNFALPEGAREDLLRARVGLQSIGDGVNVMSGHANGVAFRFFENAELNKEKSKKAKCSLFDKEDMIEWTKSKRSKPTEKVRFLPPELLQVDQESGEVTGHPAYVEAYKRYKAKMAAPGTPLDKWGALDSAEIATLAAAGIFSVEQFATSPRSKITGKFPKNIIEKFEEATYWMNGQQGRFDVDRLATENVELQKKLEASQQKHREELAAMSERLAALEGKSSKKKAKAQTEDTENGD